MVICLVSQHYPPQTAQGGVGTQTWNKARWLARLGHTVHVLSCAAGPGPDLTTERDGDVVVHRMQPPGQQRGVEFPVYEGPTYMLGYTWEVLRHLHTLMRSTAFDVFDFPEYGAEGFAYQLDRTRWNWVPVVVQLHAPVAMLAAHIGWPEPDSDAYRVGSFMEGVSITHADRLMACSANIADFTSTLYGVPRSDIDVVHCGVDAEAFRPGDRARPNGRATVLFVGNIAPSKGVKTAFDAAMRLRSKYPDVRLQIAGAGDAGLVEALQAHAQSSGADRTVEFLGFVDRARLPELYRQADVFCSPAQYEGGVANVFIEAMACGCPVVASTAGGAPEAVVDGETGFLVPPNDVEATSCALDRILGNAALRERMSEACRLRIEEYFSMDKYIQRVLATYERAIELSHRNRQGLSAAFELRETV